jgi:hypothetical protein
MNARSNRRFRPRLEYLEGRDAPAALDLSAGVVTQGSLDEATASALSSQSISISGTYAFVTNHDVTISGSDANLGAFNGTVQDHGDTHHKGTGTLTFATGTLVISYDVSLNRDQNLLVGTWTATGGTGSLSGVSGGGVMTIQPVTVGNGFTMTGTLSS